VTTRLGSGDNQTYPESLWAVGDLVTKFRRFLSKPGDLSK
jgi:hypothetical protein